MPKRPIANTPEDPTLSRVAVNIAGKEYWLCFDFRALAEARAHFRAQGHREFNLMAAMAQIDADTVSVIFPCAVHKFHPELTFEDAQNLLTIPVSFVVGEELGKAWGFSMPEPEKEASPAANPPLP
jgi:hypothetical protein